MGHQRGSDTVALAAGDDAERGDARHLVSVQVAHGREDVPDDDATLVGDQLQSLGPGPPAPGLAHDVDLFGRIAPARAEGVTHHGQDRRLVGRLRRPDVEAGSGHVRGSRTLTVTT